MDTPNTFSFLFFFHFGELYFVLFIMYMSITRSNAMIFEAFSTLKEQNGLDTNTIANFIEVHIEVPIFLVSNYLSIIVILLIQSNLALYPMYYYIVYLLYFIYLSLFPSLK